MAPLQPRDHGPATPSGRQSRERRPAASPHPGVTAVLAMQRDHGNQATAHAVGQRGQRLLMRQFATLEKDLAPSVAGELKVVVPAAEVDLLDTLWKSHMTVTPAEFVRRALVGLQPLVAGHDRVYVLFKRTGPAKVSFDIKLQESREAATRPASESATRGWAQIGATRWVRNLAGATRELSFADDSLQVADARTDAPTGTAGGSGFTKQLFRNLLALYAEAKPGVAIDITADEEGRYVWARYGFLPASGEWLEKIRDPIRAAVVESTGADLSERIEAFSKTKGKPVDTAAAQRIAAALERDDPPALFALVDITEAKDFLWWLFTSGIVQIWKGWLNLADPVQGPRVLAYIGAPLRHESGHGGASKSKDDASVVELSGGPLVGTSDDSK